ncbi:MAG TPA: hypothetical protein VGJ04_05770 [Pirellulales bacterium]
MIADTRLCIAIMLGLMLPALGCATVASGLRSKVTFNTNPPDAHVVIHDSNGQEVASVQTPAQVKLDRSVSMTKAAHYTATIEAPGYQPQQVDINYTLNPWTFGNILLGGIPGLIADDASGAIWKPEQDKISVNLNPLANSSQVANTPVIVPSTGNIVQAPSSTVQKVAYNQAAKLTK